MYEYVVMWITVITYRNKRDAFKQCQVTTFPHLISSERCDSVVNTEACERLQVPKDT